MDIRIRKYIQFKIRSLGLRRKELEKLKAKREELRKDVIESSPEAPDGQPRGKGRIFQPY